MLTRISPQHLANSVWAVSCLHTQLLLPPPTSHSSPSFPQNNNISPLSSHPPHTNNTPHTHPNANSSTPSIVREWLSQSLHASLPLLPLFSSQELSNLLTGLARLSQPPSHAFHPSLISTEWWARAGSVSRLLLPQAETQHLLSTLWALGVLGHKPEGVWARALCKKVGVNVSLCCCLLYCMSAT